jgi:transposase
MNTMKPENNPAYQLEIGIDVSKEHLDIFDGKLSYRVSNTSKGITSLFTKIRAKKIPPRITCEASGHYTTLLIKRCFKANIPISLVNALQVKSYIRSFGKLAKTDQIDAAFIQKYAADRNPQILEASWLKLQNLKDNKTALDLLVRQRAQLKAALDKHDDPFIVRAMKSHLKTMNRAVAKLETNLNELISADKEMQTKRELIETVSGVGPKTSLALVIGLPELGTLNRVQVACLIGVAPIHRESGKMNGKRYIGGGRKNVRTALYMAAVVASRCNEKFKGFYKQLRERGKPARVAYIAVVRKLVIYLNTLLKNEFSPI